MTDPEVADLLRKLAREAQSLQTYFRCLLLYDPALAVVNARAIRDVNARLAILSCRMEKLAGFAESAQDPPLCD
ncbi:MAG TPA: hypothetical protein VM182_06235 [Terriglobia bacterium]|nr:hypothetical protein [Terriglobia bacterium]